MNTSAIRYGFGLLLLLFVSTVWAEISIPKLSQRVTDVTATLSEAQRAGLEEKLAAFEAQKGSQIAVLIVSTTQPQDIAEYGIQVADLWQIGRKKIDDGIIVIVAKDDHKLRIEVGRGLEGVIPDVIAKRIIADVITPYFKAGDFAGGIDAGVTQIIKLVDGETLPAPSTQSVGQQGSNEGGYLFVLIAGLFAGSVLSSIFGRVMGGTIAGFGSAALVSILFGLGIAAAIVGFMVFFMVGVGGNGGGWSNGGGFGRGGGSGWGGGSTGGGFGGGGGGFGGGGASGSW